MGLTLSMFILISGKKILKPTWFEHVYCGLTLGFAKDHKTHNSFVRCLLCRQDVRIASRGITTFWEHCRGGQTSPTPLPSTIVAWLGFAQARRDPYVKERGGRVQCHIDWRSSASNRGLPKRVYARSATNRVSWRVCVGRNAKLRRCRSN